MIVVTGGAGFIGSAMVWELNRHGIQDILIVDDLKSSDKWRNLVGLRYSEYMQKDEFFVAFTGHAHLPEITAVIHMGACSTTTEKNAEYLYQNNFNYTKLLAEYCLSKNIRFIYASSAATYGEGEKGFADSDNLTTELLPINMYGYSKHLFDLHALKHRLLSRIAGLKFFNVYGPNEYHKGDMKSVIAKAFHQINETGKLKLFKSNRKEYEDGGQKRDFVYVKDCVRVIWFLLQNPETNGLFNLGTGQARTWNDLAKATFHAMGKPVNIEYIDMPENLKNSYQYFTQADMQKLRQAGYTEPFTTLEQGVKDYIQNYMMQPFPYLKTF